MKTPPGPVNKPSPAETPEVENQEHCEKLLDESIEETFPASDPIAPSDFSIPPLQPEAPQESDTGKKKK